MSEPRFAFEYTDRQVAAARRVLVDVGQVLASFADVVVLIGGWVPDLLIPDGVPKHSGSLDLDLALHSERLTDGRYAELLQLLLDTRRYQLGEKSFQLVTQVDLADGGVPLQVDVDFLAPTKPRLKGDDRLEGFRVLQAEACAAAFTDPEEVEVSGAMVGGARNTVRWRVAALVDFLVMKAWALAGRDKPKDAYDICYCLEHGPGGFRGAARALQERLGGPTRPLVQRALQILAERFASVDHYGPDQYVGFLALENAEEAAIARQRAYQLVAQLLAEFPA